VIEFPKKAKIEPWRFYGFESLSRTRPVDDWYRDELTEDAQFALRDSLKAAKKVDDFTDWLCWKRFLSGKYRKYKIWELWFSCADKREYRLLGVFRPKKQAIIVLGCYHKGGVYTPTDALETAFNRAKALAEMSATTYERKIPDDL
jgi:hypothetical protein